MPNTEQYLDDEPQMDVSPQLGEMLHEDNNLKSIMENFWPSNWKRLHIDQQVLACQNLENYLACESGRAPFTIIPSTDTNKYGFTNYKKRTINIDMHEHPYDIISSVVHESRHADQGDLMQKRLSARCYKNTRSDYTKALEQKGLMDNDVFILTWETIHYINGESDIDDNSDAQNEQLYKTQLMEIDAEFKSFKFLKKYSEYMGDGEDFAKHLKKQERELKKIQNVFKKEELAIEWFDNRRERLLLTNPALYKKNEIEHLESIYLSNNINDCDSKILSELVSWNASDELSVTSVSLEELSEGTTKRSKYRARTKAGTSPKAKEKRKSGWCCNVV